MTVGELMNKLDEHEPDARLYIDGRRLYAIDAFGDCPEDVAYIGHYEDVTWRED